MDKKKGLINVAVSVAFRILFLVANFLARRLLIRILGNEYNGLDALYVSLLDILSVAELGVGSAITYCMYKPIVEGDNDKVSALYGLFTKFYFIVGAVILIAGCALMPFLRFFAKDYESLDTNLYLTFGLCLISVVLSYAFSAKSSLINAYKNNYITTTIYSLGVVFQCALQIVVLVLTESFVWYVACKIAAVCLQWAATEIIARKKYGNIIGNRQKADDETKKEVVKNSKAMMMHKIGSRLVNTADSTIISAFLGLVILGKYSNYIVIVSAMIALISLFFTPLSSVIGHMFVESKEETERYHKFFHTFNFMLGIVFFLGFYAVINDLISIVFGDGLELSKAIVIVITVNYFIQFMKNATGLFRDATGTFYNDRWKPLVEGAFNIVLSILFVLIFPDEYKVVGVIVATIITNLFICHVVEPYVFFKHALNRSPVKYYIRNYAYIAVFVGALFLLDFCTVSFGNKWLDLLVNGFIAVGIALAVCLATLFIDKDTRYYLKKHFLKR